MVDALKNASNEAKSLGWDGRKCMCRIVNGTYYITFTMGNGRCLLSVIDANGEVIA